MRFSFFLGLFVFFLVASPASYAKGERYGVSAQLFSFDSITTDEGEAGSNDALRFGFVHTRPIDENNARWRWWFGVNYLSTDVPAPLNGVYQEVQNLELRVVPQYAFSLFDWLTPYVGAGISAGYSLYSDRWIVDDEGYKYGERLEDTSVFEFGLVLNAGTVIKFGSNPDAHLQLVPQVSYIYPLNDGLGGLELSFAILF